MSEALVDRYDAALFDLDGVVYLGPDAVAAAPGTIAQLRGRGVRVGFVTNNAARATTTVAHHLTRLGMPTEPEEVVSSAQAVAGLAAQRLGEGARVLVTGTPALADEVASRGLEVVAGARDEPQAVIQGYDPDIAWPSLEEAGFALQGGARWFAANPDITRPTDRGLVPGIGTQIQVVASVSPVEPEMAGKPFRPLLDATVDRLGCETPIFVGDRLDTDILGAHNAGMDSLFVLTGAHGVHDLLNADPAERPTHVASDLSGLLDPPAHLTVTEGVVRCGRASAAERGGRAVVIDLPEGRQGHLDALRALLHLVHDEGVRADHDEVDRLSELA